MAPSPATTHDLSLVLPQNVSHLLSTPRLVVEVLSPSNEILSDSLRFVVEQEKERPVRNNFLFWCFVNWFPIIISCHSYSIQLEVSVKPEVAEPGEVVEVVVKAEPFTSVYLLSTSDLLVFEPKEQQLRKLMVSWKIISNIHFLWHICCYFKTHEKMLRYLRSLNSSQFSHTVDEFGESTSTFPSLAPDSQRVHNVSWCWITELNWPG